MPLRRGARHHGVGERAGRGRIGSGCLFVKSPLSPGPWWRRSDGGARRALSNEMASNIVVVVRGICVGRIGRGWLGAARVTREINYTLLEVLTSDRTPEADSAAGRASSPPSAPSPRCPFYRCGVLLFSDDENRLRFFFSRERLCTSAASTCRRCPLRCLSFYIRRYVFVLRNSNLMQFKF